jgi:hypothetical protein
LRIKEQETRLIRYENDDDDKMLYNLSIMTKLGEGKIFGLVTEEIGSGLPPPVDACKRDGLCS